MHDRAKALLNEGILLREIVRADVFRVQGDGSYLQEELPVRDLIVTTGLNYIATRISGGDAVASAMAYMAVGTSTTVASLNQTTLPGEVKRKALAIGSANVTAANVWTAVATFGGAADSVTSLALTEAGVWNSANSGAGTMMQRVTFAAVTLAASDLLRLTLETNVGSTG